MMTPEMRLLSEIQAFCARSGMAETTFGQRAVHQWRLVDHLKSGTTVTLTTAERVREFIASNSRTQIKGRSRRRDKCHA